MVSIVDYYSSYPEVHLSTDIWASTIIRWLQELFAHYSCPDEIVMDNGPQFARSQEFILFLEQHGVRPIPVSVYNLRENGLVERWNRTLKGGIQAFTALDRPWEEGITDLLTQHRHMPYTQGQSPASLLLGRNTQMSFELPAEAMQTGTDTGERSCTVLCQPPETTTTNAKVDWSRLHLL